MHKVKGQIREYGWRYLKCQKFSRNQYIGNMVQGTLFKSTGELLQPQEENRQRCK